MKTPNLIFRMASILSAAAALSVSLVSARGGDVQSGAAEPSAMKKTEVVRTTTPARVTAIKAEKAKAKRVEVTGSRIRVKAPTAQELQHGDSQIQVMDQRHIRRSGRPDLGGVLNHLPSTR